MRSKLSNKSFACYIDKLPHTFIIWKYLFFPGKSVFERPIDLITVGNPNNVNLKREVFDRMSLTKKIYNYLFREDWTNFNFLLLETCILVFLCITDCLEKGDTGYWWRGWKWFFPHEQSKLLQNERSECSGRLKFERVFKKL